MRRPDPLPQNDPSPDPLDDSLLGSLSDLVEDGRTLVEAELDYQRKRLSFGLASSKSIVALVLLGVALLFFALMALIVGLLLALTTVLGPWGALGVVFGGIMLATGLSFLGAFLKFRRAKAVLIPQGEA